MKYVNVLTKLILSWTRYTSYNNCLAEFTTQSCTCFPVVLYLVLTIKWQYVVELLLSGSAEVKAKYS